MLSTLGQLLGRLLGHQASLECLVSLMQHCCPGEGVWARWTSSRPQAWLLGEDLFVQPAWRKSTLPSRRPQENMHQG